jgi:type VI secretion system protein ImpC
MPQSKGLGKLSVNLAASLDDADGVPDEESPFHVAILGDFSGRVNRGLRDVGAALAGRKAHLVDRDNLDDVMAAMRVQMSLGRVGPDQKPITLQFKCLDDFHPDRIYERVELFQTLRATRARLQNPATFADAAATVRAWSKIESAPFDTAGEPEPVPTPNPLSVENLFEQTMQQTQRKDTEERSSRGRVDWNDILREIVEPYSMAGADPQLPQLVACVDTAATEIMRAILHHPDFQQLESAWRGIYFLIRRVETDSRLKLFLFDVSKEELAGDLAANEDLATSGIYKLLVERTLGTPGAVPWGVLVGCFTFDATTDDALTMGRMTKIAHAAHAPFIGGASTGFLGCHSLGDTPDADDWQASMDSEAAAMWANVRELPESNYAGLAIPRFLLRLPYGPRTDPTEQFLFEELPEGSPHECYLWGNPALACACLIAQSFGLEGWGFQFGRVQQIDNLPVHVSTKSGEREVKASAEAFLSIRAIEKIAGLGLMPLASIQGQDAVRLWNFQSISKPARPLAGRWGRSES